MSFATLSNKLIHPSFQRDELLLTKAKTLLILLLFFLFVLLGYTTIFIVNDVFYNTKALLNYFGIFAVTACLLILRKSTNLKYPLRVLNYVGFALITGGVYWSGGFASNDILWYSVVAVSSLLFIGKVDGIIVTILSLCAIIGFYIIDIWELIEFPFDPLTQSIHYRFVNAAIITLILCSLTLILVQRNYRLHKIIHDIQAAQIRESISQDFHDELGNKLASVVHISKRLKSSKNHQEQQAMLDIIENETQQVYDNFRDFIWTNDPNSVIVSSLFMYLTDFNQQFFAHQDITVEGELLPSNYSGPEKVSSNIIRHIVPLYKELMTNIHKHAQASRIDWSLKYYNNQLTLKISDNGIGFNLSEQNQGQGIKNIQKRVDEIQGNYNITTQPGMGTHITLCIDLNKTYTHA